MVPEPDLDPRSELPAGGFSSWLSGLERARRDEQASDVPCGHCTACCTSSQFIHIGPDETETLDRIPAELLFPAPGRPEGHVLMGYDEDGHCPMLVDDACSIYADRPRTCRTYDCRIFPATGIDPGSNERPRIARQAERWRFTLASDADRTQHAAVRSAATFLQEHRDRFADGELPSNPTQLAVLAIEVHDAFLQFDEETRSELVEVEIRQRLRRRDTS